MASIQVGLLVALASMVGKYPGDERETAAETPCELSVAWHDAYGLHPLGGDGVGHEVERVLGSVGISTCWHVGEEGARAQAGIAVRVVLMPHDGSRWELPRQTLGTTVGRKDPRETIFVLFPNVIGTLGYDAESMDLAKRALLSRALGRIVVHELIHATLPGHPHAESGVFQQRLGPRLLTGWGSAIDPLTACLLAARVGSLDLAAPRERPRVERGTSRPPRRIVADRGCRRSSLP